MALEVTSKSEVLPIRSLVSVGAADETMLARALEVGSDALFFDLEEPEVPYGPKEKARARAAVAHALDAAGDAGRRPLAFVRVHHPRTGETTADLRAIMKPSLTGVFLPKTSGPADIHMLDGVLTCMELEAGLPLGSTQIFPFLETAEGIRSAYEIGCASPRITYLGGMVSRFGDVHQAIGYRWTPRGEESLYLRSKVLIDARAAGIRYPVSGGWGGSLADEDDLRAWATALRDLGYFGMLIGAGGVGIAHEVFSPRPGEIALWEELVALGEAADASGGGPVMYRAPDGTLEEVHEAYIGSARLNLAWARALGD